VAATLSKMGRSVSVVEAADRLLARVASPSVANFLSELHRAHGVSVFTGIGVEKIIKEDDFFEGVALNDGTILKGDMLVVGIGVNPNSDLACDAGIETEHANGGAIIVNEFLQTNNHDVFAIGDVALKQGQSLRIESVHNAQDSAARAAAKIMGKDPPKLQAPWFWSDQYDISLQSVGIVPTDADDVYQVARKGRSEGGRSFWSYREKQLIAVEAIDDADNFMLGKECLEHDVSPDPDLICDPEFNPMG
jgi:NADPH-dependent 2,4-dienoyl-CoA reductase/sulfur reductase-like enzyme